ncbi:unnamed protein product, partial [Chrysoparadoxa australica]
MPVRPIGQRWLHQESRLREAGGGVGSLHKWSSYIWLRWSTVMLGHGGRCGEWLGRLNEEEIGSVSSFMVHCSNSLEFVVAGGERKVLGGGKHSSAWGRQSFFHCAWHV